MSDYEYAPYVPESQDLDQATQNPLGYSLPYFPTDENDSALQMGIQRSLEDSQATKKKRSHKTSSRKTKKSSGKDLNTSKHDEQFGQFSKFVDESNEFIRNTPGLRDNTAKLDTHKIHTVPVFANTTDIPMIFRTKDVSQPESYSDPELCANLPKLADPYQTPETVAKVLGPQTRQEPATCQYSWTEKGKRWSCTKQAFLGCYCGANHANQARDEAEYMKRYPSTSYPDIQLQLRNGYGGFFKPGGFAAYDDEKRKEAADIAHQQKAAEQLKSFKQKNEIDLVSAQEKTKRQEEIKREEKARQDAEYEKKREAKILRERAEQKLADDQRKQIAELEQKAAELELEKTKHKLAEQKSTDQISYDFPLMDETLEYPLLCDFCLSKLRPNDADYKPRDTIDGSRMPNNDKDIEVFSRLCWRIKDFATLPCWGFASDEPIKGRTRKICYILLDKYCRAILNHVECLRKNQEDVPAYLKELYHLSLYFTKIDGQFTKYGTPRQIWEKYHPGKPYSSSDVKPVKKSVSVEKPVLVDEQSDAFKSAVEAAVKLAMAEMAEKHKKEIIRKDEDITLRTNKIESLKKDHDALTKERDVLKQERNELVSENDNLNGNYTNIEILLEKERVEHKKTRATCEETIKTLREQLQQSQEQEKKTRAGHIRMSETVEALQDTATKSLETIDKLEKEAKIVQKELTGTQSALFAAHEKLAMMKLPRSSEDGYDDTNGSNTSEDSNDYKEEITKLKKDLARAINDVKAFEKTAHICRDYYEEQCNINEKNVDDYNALYKKYNALNRIHMDCAMSHGSTKIEDKSSKRAVVGPENPSPNSTGKPVAKSPVGGNNANK